MATRAVLEQKLRKADAMAQRGDAQAKKDAARIAAAIKNNEFDEVSNDAVSFLQGAGQGATLGFSDEIMSGIAALGPTLFGGKSDITPENRNIFEQYRDNYGDALASTRQDIDTARQEDPWTTFAGEMAGGMLTGGAAGTKAAAGKSLTEGAKALGMASGKIGAVAGYGYSKADPLKALTEGDREKAVDEATTALGDTAIGAGTGAVAGYAFPFIGAGVRALGRYAYGLSPNGKKVVFNEKAKAALIDAYKRDVAGGYIKPDEAMRELAEIPELVLGDMGPSLRNEMMRVGQTYTAGGSGIRQFVVDRNRKQFDRIFPKLSRALTGKDDVNFGILKRDMIADKKKAADAMYGAISDKPAALDNTMRNILKNPQTKKALKHANTLREIEGKPPIDTKKLLQSQMSTDELQSILEGMRSTTDSLFTSKGGSKKIANAYKESIYKPFRDGAYRLNKELAEAQKVWRDNTAVEEAMEMGERIFRDDYEMTELMKEGLSEAEQVAHRLGALKAFRDAMESRSFDADLLKSVTNSRKKEKMLEAAFGSKQKFREFMEYLSNEDKMFQTMKEATSNSLTAQRLLQQDPNIGKKFASQAGYNVGLGRTNDGPMGVGPRLTGFLAETAAELINPEAGRLARMERLTDRQAQILMNKDLGLLKPQTVGGLLDSGVPRSAAPIVPGLMATGAPHNEDYGY